MSTPPVSLPFLFRRVSLWVWPLPKRKVADPMWPSVAGGHTAINVSSKQHELKVMRHMPGQCSQAAAANETGCQQHPGSISLEPAQ